MPGKNLTRDEAAARASILTVESYAVRLDLTTGPEHFRTVTTVRFSCSEPGADTFIDLIAASVEAVTLNGVELDPERGLRRLAHRAARPAGRQRARRRRDRQLHQHR